MSNESLILQVIELHEQGFDFADAFHLVLSTHCSDFYTFDEKFIKKSQNSSTLAVRKPDL